MNIAIKNPIELRDPLDSIAEALFEPMGVDGVYGRTALFDKAVDGLTGLITRHREPDTEVLRFPPVMSRRQLEKSGYLRSFPHLVGCVSCLHGSEGDIRAVVDGFEAGHDWMSALSPADLVLNPAACYPVYPMVASRGSVPKGSLLFDVTCDCFRHEPSQHLDRLQSFRMREYVCVGTSEQICDFRERWMKRAQAIADQLRLAHRIEEADDPLVARDREPTVMPQIEPSSKLELLIPLRSAAQPTACISFNDHRDHFGTTWGIRTEAGEIAHTGCIAFGIDRLAVALFRTHGLDLATWPAPVREALAI